MNIRYSTKKDAELLAKIGAETFWDTYSTSSKLEHAFIKAYITKTFERNLILSEISKDNLVYLIGEIDSESIAYVRLLNGNSRKEISGESPFNISRIYLRKKFWGKGLGSLLINRCFQEAEKHKSDVIWLSVWNHNERAITFYEKFGFRKVGKHFFDLAGSPQLDYLMERKL